MERTRGLGRVLLSLALGASSLVALGADSPSSARTRPALLEVVAERVVAGRSADALQLVLDRTVLSSGDLVATDATGRAIVTFEDGSTVEIDPNTTFSYVVVTNGLGEAVVQMIQGAGRVLYAITRTLSPRSRYELTFPGGAAVARAGTAFETRVGDDGSTEVTPRDGTVTVTSGGTSIEVAPGQRAIVRPGSAPVTAPATPRPSSSPAASAPPASPSAPAAAPTAPPTAPRPTGAPSSSPAPPPTRSPTATPPQTPAPSPTPAPTATATPSSDVLPTILPSGGLPTPTPVPTDTPGDILPSLAPTLAPTAAPTLAPLPTVSILPTPTLAPLQLP